jgi:hypothetical protein
MSMQSGRSMLPFQLLRHPWVSDILVSGRWNLWVAAVTPTSLGVNLTWFRTPVKLDFEKPGNWVPAKKGSQEGWITCQRSTVAKCSDQLRGRRILKCVNSIETPYPCHANAMCVSIMTLVKTSIASHTEYIYVLCNPVFSVSLCL